MREYIKLTPPLLLAAYTFLCLGISSLTYTLLLLQDHYFKGFSLISLSLIGFGIGEILNHPKESVSHEVGVSLEKAHSFIRKRNACGLGNLLAIMSILLFFIGLSSLIF